jgi:hypothetical protein
MMYTRRLAMTLLSLSLVTLTACDKDKKEDSKVAQNVRIERFVWTPKAETEAAITSLPQTPLELSPYQTTGALRPQSRSVPTVTSGRLS